VPITGEEIRRRLAEFAAHWGGFQGSERAEAQTFLNQLLECYGTDRQTVGARFEEFGPGGFMDMIWPGVCIVEMKRPSEAGKLELHRKQALDYWTTSGTPESPAPRWVVLCAFHRFEIWEPGAVFTEPRTAFDLAELPDRLDSLLFLAGAQPVFTGTQAELTRDAAAKVTAMLGMLQERKRDDPDVLRDFALQCVWCMFAEDLQMLPGHLFTRVVEGLLRDPDRSSTDDIGQLFRYLDEKEARPTQGLYAGVPYADGELFRKPAGVHLELPELKLLREACESPWHRVEPAIFGSLLEGALGRERQWALGAHYTAEADILKVVLPSVIDPWRERLATVKTLADAEAAQSDLLNFVVLDPACGSGNFLYVAYRELRRFENELRERAAELRAEAGMPEQGTIGFFPLTNMRGIELEPFGVKLARVTLWMGHKLAVNELGLSERTLPLANLAGIQRADALKVEWPKADAIIGNPPYHGSQRIRGELGDEYAKFLQKEFGIGLRDYAVYWFRKAHEALPDGGRAGLVATNSVSQGRAREVSLDWIVENGGVIFSAVSTQDWTGLAAVDVSIVNWVRNPSDPPTCLLDGVEVEGITPALRPLGSDVSGALRLTANRARSFQGPIPAGAGFILDDEEAEALLVRDEADYSNVVRLYLIGEDIADDPAQAPRRWIINFEKKPLEEAGQFPAALQIVRERVKPERDVANREPNKTYWWQFERPRIGMQAALGGLTRFIAANAQGKRIHFTWQAASTCPSNLTNVFAFDDDYSMGALLTSMHQEWARAQSSTLEDRFRYTPTSAFETFPWPQPTDEQREGIADAGRQLLARRSAICLEREIGLTKLYNEVDDGAYRDLADLHRMLDEAAAEAYGWPKSAAHDSAESNRRLLELNLSIAAGQTPYDGP